MKKLLLSSVAFGALALAPAVANAQVDLNIGGFFNAYGAYVDQDEDGTDETKDLDMLRHTEIHFSGETVLDNGLTVGAHIEITADGGDTSDVDESYLYFSGSWGRVNIGDEDGAAYLLQVSAPSADSNVDGIRQFIQPVNYTVLQGTGITQLSNVIGNGLDYDNDLGRLTDKVTYLSPIMNGFQGGFSYTPDSDANAANLAGVGFDDVTDADGSIYELAIRYEGEFNGVGVALGAGYAEQELETATTPIVVGTQTDDIQEWNVGVDLDFGAFGLGVIYTENDNGEVQNAADTGSIDEEETFVVGVDYTTGAFKFGATYFDSENTFGLEDVDTKRYTGGVTYSYAPGVSFRGSLSFVDHEDVIQSNGAAANTVGDLDATSLLIGTKIDF